MHKNKEVINTDREIKYKTTTKEYPDGSRVISHHPILTEEEKAVALRNLKTAMEHCARELYKAKKEPAKEATA